jgi:toxin ParE1/3/4
LSEQADAGLLQIYRYLSERSTAAAQSVAGEINRKMQNLGDLPFIGRDRSMLSQGIRSVVAHPYVIFYAVESHWIVVMRVLHGRRDIDAEFQR